MIVRFAGLLVLVALGAVVQPSTAAAQVSPPPPPEGRDTVTVVPGSEFEAGPIQRFFLGDNRRDLWLREVTAPVLDLDTFAGGLTPVEQGGNQSKTLHMETPDGRTFLFRSVDKYPDQPLPEDLRGTLVEKLIQDQVSALHPGGSLVVPRLHEALGHLPIQPVYYVMPDHPRLGEYRETFAGMLGTVILRPDEGPRGEALYRGSHRVVGTDELYDKLGDSPRHRVVAREFLEARLIGLLVGDSDRGPDQWRWARTPADSGFVWRPIIRDRDWAFVDADGISGTLTREVYPKLVEYERTFPPVRQLTWADVGMGRRLLSELDRGAWEQAVDRVQNALTDEVIREAVAHLPEAQKPGHADELAATLRARRDRLGDIAMEWYRRLAPAVEVHGTDLPDRAEIVRRDDGSLQVTLYAPAGVLEPIIPGRGDDAEQARDHAADPYYRPDIGWTGPADAWAPYYRRVFDPAHTEEVRIYLEEGADTAVVRGTGAREIAVRVIGGEGDDVMHDAGSPSALTAFYDAEGRNRLVPGRRTEISRKAYEPPAESDDFIAHRTGADRVRDWGHERSWFSPAFDYEEGAGVILGGGPVWTDYGFRAVPYASRVSVTGLVATLTGGLGIDIRAEGRPPNSSAVLRLHGRATQFDGTRFYGYGNQTPAYSEDASLIMRDRAFLEATIGTESQEVRGEIGLIGRYTDPRVPAANPAALVRDPFADVGGDPGDDTVYPTAAARGAGAMGEVGAVARLEIERVDDDDNPGQGLALDLEAEAIPAAGGRAGPWAHGRAEGRAYLRLPVLTEPVLAGRIGGRASAGEFPIHGAAWIGGSSTLRGYRWQRFAGDRALYGGVDLRVPLFRANLLIASGILGVIGFADAGRVWFDGESPGDWHVGRGAGLQFETLGTAAHVLWARGSGDRLYVGLRAPF